MSFSLNYKTQNPLDRDKDIAEVLDDLTSSTAAAYTFQTLPDPTTYIGNAFVLDVGVRGSLWRSDGVSWGLVGGECVLFNKTTTTAALTGTTTETLLDEFVIPGGLLGSGGSLIVTSRLTTTNNANVKTFRVKLNGVAGTALNDPQLTSIATTTCTTYIDNVSASSQIGGNGSSIGSGTTNAWRTAAVNTASNFTVSLTGQLANSADSIQVVTTRVVLVRL